MAQRRRPSNNPCGQLSFVIPLLLLLSSAGTYYVAASSTFYSSCCPSPVPAPDRHTDDHAELLKPFHLPTGFFSGNASEILFSPDIGGMFGRIFSFVPQNLSRTADPALLHLAGTLKLSGQRVVTYEKDGEVRGWHRYKVAISFNLDGYYSTTTSQLCMVGTGTEATSDDTPDGPVKHYADVAVHLRVPSRPSLTDPFVTGSLDGAEFETISLVAYAEGNGVYKYSGRASCPPAAAAMPTTARRHVLQPQHGGFSCAAVRGY